MGHPDLLRALDIVTEIVTMHWTPAGCRCWICTEARRGDIPMRSSYMEHLRTRPSRGYVHVDRTVNVPYAKSVYQVKDASDI